MTLVSDQYPVIKIQYEVLKTPLKALALQYGTTEKYLRDAANEFGWDNTKKIEGPLSLELMEVSEPLIVKLIVSLLDKGQTLASEMKDTKDYKAMVAAVKELREIVNPAQLARQLEVKTSQDIINMIGQGKINVDEGLKLMSLMKASVEVEAQEAQLKLQKSLLIALEDEEEDSGAEIDDEDEEEEKADIQSD